jgi:hypothetical protein
MCAYRIIFIYYVLVLACSFSDRSCHAEMEAKWTPNEQEEGGGGPLPLSQNQREQLLKLHQTILNSPDPQATLQQVADSNDMNVNDLADLLNRNYAFFQNQSGLAGHSRNVWKSVSVVLASLFHSAFRHPRAASILLVTLLAVFHLLWMSPRTGVVLSNSRSIFSRGPTTLFSPPVPYLKFTSTSSSFWKRYDNRPLSIRNLDAWKIAQEKIISPDQDSVQVLKVKGLKQVVVAQTTVVNWEEDEDDNDEVELLQQQQQQNWENRLEWTWEHASRILAMREITEWIPEDLPSMRLVVASLDEQPSSSPKKSKSFCSLVVEKLGDWRRYAVIPFQITQEDDSSLTLTTMKGAQFDGQIHIAIMEQNNNEEEKGGRGGAYAPVVVRVSLIVPKDSSSTALSNYWAQTLVRGISESVSNSIRTRTSQSQVRSSQSASVRHAAGSSAKRKRHARLEKETLLEEMAADRRRRWQRQNPNAGHYRPSGERMRSPKNAIAFQ